MKYGKLEIIGKQFRTYIGNDNKKRTMVVCKCDCGFYKCIQYSSLKAGNTLSCGCLRKIKGNQHHRYKGYNEITGTLWCDLQFQAQKRNIEFNLTIEYIWSLFINQNKKCALSGIDIVFASNRTEEKTASLDRIDSTKGYIEGNVQWIHKTINKMKTDLLEKTFLNFCQIISRHQNENSIYEY